jgi:hypothetical protein
MSAISQLAVLLAVLPLGILWRGYVLTVLWAWFVPPLFAEAPTLTLLPAIGLSLIVGYLTHQAPPRTVDTDRSRETLHLIVGAVLTPAFALLIGWIVWRLS